MSPARAAYLVVDASVSLKWALDDEENMEEALALRDDGIRGRFLMVAPSLWLYEVANGLITATRRGRVPLEAGRELLSNLTLVGVRFSDPEIEDCYEAALRHGVALYDAVYLALAEALGAPLWTGDRKFFGSSGSSVGRLGALKPLEAAPALALRNQHAPSKHWRLAEVGIGTSHPIHAPSLPGSPPGSAGVAVEV